MRSLSVAMHDFAAGWLGGIAGVLVSHPIDTIRTRQCVSTGGTSEWAEFRPSRLRSLYSGVFSPCVSVGAWKAVTLSTNERLKAFLTERRSGTAKAEPAQSDVFLAASLSGSLSSLVCAPFEQIKARAMLERPVATPANSRGAWAASLQLAQREARVIWTVVREAGVFRGLYKGAPLLLLRDGYSTGFFLSSYHYIKQALSESGRFSPTATSLAAGAIAGPIGWIVCYPVEVVRIYWQGQPGWGSYGAVVRHVYKQGGVAAFFRGLPACCVRSSLQISMTMTVFDALTRSV